MDSFVFEAGLQRLLVFFLWIPDFWNGDVQTSGASGTDFRFWYIWACILGERSALPAVNCVRRISKTPERRLIFGTELYHWSLITFWRSAFDVPAAFSFSPFRIFLDLILIWIRIRWLDLFWTDYWLIILHNCILRHNRPMRTVELSDFWAAFSKYSIFRSSAHRPTVSFKKTTNCFSFCARKCERIVWEVLKSDWAAQ